MNQKGEGAHVLLDQKPRPLLCSPSLNPPLCPTSPHSGNPRTPKPSAYRQHARERQATGDSAAATETTAAGGGDTGVAMASGMRNEGKEIPRELTINAGDNNSGSTLFRQPSGEEEGVAGAN